MATAPDTTPQPPKKASKKAQVHPVFKERLTDLKKQGENFAKAFKREEQRKWNIPSDLSASDLFQIASLHKPSFEREPINTNYLQCFQSKDDMGTTGDVVSLKFQIDYNAMEERAFRFRHASVCRNLSHAMSRRRAMGDGPMFPHIEQQASNAIKAGAK
jgi:hypothetical protein